jgi:hypothetical protein
MKLMEKKTRRAERSPWDSATQELLAAVPERLRSSVSSVLANPRLGGRGLRAWLALLAAEERELPESLTDELIEVYLREDDAEPLHDCERCGLAVPVRASRRCGHEAVVERTFFSKCPHCGGATGRFAYWSRSN